MENTGYISIDRVPSDWLIGGQGDFFSPLTSKKLINFNNWEAFLPVVEYQNNGGYDRMACVTYSILNCLEILHVAQTGKEANFSDRYIAKLSNTSKYGNNVATVFDTIRTNGLVSENDWADVKTDWNDYYKAVPNEVIGKGKDFIKNWDIYREYVGTGKKDVIFDALNYAPLQVIVAYASGEGLLNPSTDYNHAVTCYGAEKGVAWFIYDHYTQTRKKYAWDYEFGCIVKPTFKLKETNMFKPVNNNLYMLVEGKTQVLGMGLDGKLVVFADKADTILNAASRSGQYQVPHPITLAQYNSVVKVDGKGSVIK